jgi:hypothetical protein
MPWLRLWDDALDSIKVQGLDPATYKTWVNVLMAASRHRAGGELPPIATLAFWLRTDRPTVETHVTTLCEAGLIDRDGDIYQVHDWSHWQPPSDHSTGRSKARRAKKRQGATAATALQRSCNGDATAVQRPRSDQIRSETDSETECEDAHARDPVSIPDRIRDCPPAYQAIIDRAKVLWAGKSDAFPRDLRAAWGWDGKLTAYWDEKKPQAFLDALEDLSAKERPEWTVARYLVFVNTCDRRLRVDAARTTPAAGREVPYKPTRHDGPAVTEADIEAKRRWEQTIKFA